MKHNKLLLGALALATVLLVGLSACGSQGSKSGASKQKSITVTMALSDEEWKVMRQDVLPKFEKSSGIKVNAIQVEAPDVIKKLQAQKGAGTAQIDVVAQDVNNAAPLVAQGLLKDLSKYKNIVSSQAIGKVAKAGVYDGKTYLFPYRPNVEINYYNATKFAKYNLTPPKNWDELLNVAKTLKEKESIGRLGLKMSFDGDAIELAEFIRSAGGDPLKFNDTGTKAAYTYLKKLWPYLSPDTTKATFATTNQFLAKDEVYYIPNWPFATNIVVDQGNRKDIKAYKGFSGPKGEVKTLGGEMLGVSSTTKKTSEAIKFIKFMEQKSTQVTLMEKNGWPSFRDDILGSQSGWKKSYYDATAQALAVAQPLPSVKYWPQAQQYINEASEKILVQNADITSTLNEYAKKIQALK